MIGAAMPEAAIDEDGKLEAWEHDVRTTPWNWQWIINAKSEAAPMKL